MTRAARIMREVRARANMLVPSTLRGFALKVRLFTDSEPDEWLATRDNDLITSLLGQMLSACELSPIAKCKESTAYELFSKAAAGRPFPYFDRDQAQG